MILENFQVIMGYSAGRKGGGFSSWRSLSDTKVFSIMYLAAAPHNSPPYASRDQLLLIQ